MGMGHIEFTKYRIGDTYLFGICTNYLSSSHFQDTYCVNHTFLDVYTPPATQEVQNGEHRCNGYYMHYSSDIASALRHICWTSLPSKVMYHKQQRLSKLWPILYAVYPFS